MKRNTKHTVVTLPYQEHTAGTFVAISGWPSEFRSINQCELFYLKPDQKFKNFKYSELCFYSKMIVSV